MTLNNVAVLEVDGADGNTGVFEMHIDLQIRGNLNKTYILGDRGDLVTEGIDALPDFLFGSFGGGNRRSGFWIDAGTGDITWQLSFTTGKGSDVTWGDGQGGTGPGNVTQTDASGADVGPHARQQVMLWWLSQTRTDSFGQGRLHVGEWTDGSYDDFDGESRVSADAGAFGMPLPVIVSEVELTNEPDDPSAATGSITFRRSRLFSAYDSPGWVDSTFDVWGQVTDIFDDW